MHDVPSILTRYAAFAGPLRPRGLCRLCGRARLQSRIEFVLEGCARRRREASRVPAVELLPLPVTDGFKWRTLIFYPWPVEVGIRWSK